ncbi:RxLR effector protein [Phytophthora megakarya]|uniref:RxLR effector protein n=1 Tax=Phytophthora megakarya TaxID=4795 RepID=A0A225UJR3_9STRA|nr:RxLR effector protein [Phytophthora megakarya]
MRTTSLLFVTTTALLATSNALSIDAGTRLLRKVDNTDAQDEERASFNFSLLDDILHRLPQQFQDMRNKPSYRETIFEGWRRGFIDGKGARAFMESEGLSEKAIKQFLAAYKEYIDLHPFLRKRN